MTRALFIILALVVTACNGPHYIDYFPYHDDGTPKPKVVVIPLVDSSNCELPWNVSEEITVGIHQQLMDSGEFYVPSPSEVGPVWGSIRQINLFTADLSNENLHRDFTNTDYIIALELIEHSTRQETPCVGKRGFKCCAANRLLTTRVRIKIIDIRCNAPKIVLYEVFKTCYALTPSTGAIDLGEIAWGSPGYEKTPCGIAHERLIRSLAARFEEVIWSTN